MVNKSKAMSYFIYSKYSIIQKAFNILLKITKIQGAEQMKFRNNDGWKIEKLWQVGGKMSKMWSMSKTIELNSKITCPNCGFSKVETMPTDACQFFYECTNCKQILKPQKGDCCVFCSYGSVKCPPKQCEKTCYWKWPE